MVHDYPPVTGGGLALGVRELAGLLDDEFRFTILSSRLVDHFADDRADPTLGVASRRGTLCARTTAARALRPIRRADVVVVHWTFSYRRLSTLALVVAPLLARRTACVVHTAPAHCTYNRLRPVPPGGRRILFAVTRLALRNCAEVVALSRAHAAALTAVGIRPTRVLPLPVAPRSGSRNGRPGSSRRLPHTIGVVGELSPLKGADDIPRLLRALTPEFAFRIVGRGPSAAAIARSVAALPPEQRAHVVVSDRLDPARMPDVYRSIDWLLVLSRTESQGRAALEAMLAGVIVVARPAEGIRDVVRDDVTGFLVDPANPEEVRGLLRSLRDDERRSGAVRRGAAAFAAATFAETSRAWRSFLQELTNHGATGGSIAEA
jgi:glycosyltransferase involved in cell wall biosynthesis